MPSRICLGGTEWSCYFLFGSMRTRTSTDDSCTTVGAGRGELEAAPLRVAALVCRGVGRTAGAVRAGAVFFTPASAVSALRGAGIDCVVDGEEELFATALTVRTVATDSARLRMRNIPPMAIATTARTIEPTAHVPSPVAPAVAPLVVTVASAATARRRARSGSCPALIASQSLWSASARRLSSS